MILLDTNVVAETMRPAPDPVVMEWLNQQHLESLWLSVITVMELRFGARPAGAGRTAADS